MKTAAGLLVVLSVILASAQTLPMKTDDVAVERHGLVQTDSMPEHIPNCTPNQIQRALAMMSEECTIECYQFAYGLEMVAARMAEGAACDDGASGQDWEAIEAALLSSNSCKLESDGVPSIQMLCFEASMAVEITNYVGAACIPEFDDLGMYQDPSTVSAGVLGCAASTAPELTPPGRGLREQKMNVATARDLECVPPNVQSACSGHVWRSPVSVNGECVAVCASHYCSSDFTFNYCLAVTTDTGLTSEQCTADTIVRAQCFTEGD